MISRRRLAPILAVAGLAASFAATTTHAQSAPRDSVSAAPVPAGSDTASGSAPRRPRWALVLSGGAARGLAHIGVLRALEEEGIRPDLVCGTSMGALIGALYATGYSSVQIREMVIHTDWDRIFGSQPEHFEWRDTVVPQPWLTFVGEGLQLHLPSGVVDDSYLNFTLAEYLLPAEGLAQGDFDRLAIPFRCVGTDAETTNPVVFRTGSVARAVRASISIPPVFPAVPDSNTLLVDGGLSSNLPVSTARSLSPPHILAIDVSLPPVNLTDHSSLVEVSFSIFDRLNKRSQEDTVSSADRLVWLTLPGYGPMDFAAADSLIEIGYRQSREHVHEFARLLTGSDSTARDTIGVRLPRARPEVLWLDRHGREAPRSDVAGHLFGEPPQTPFDPRDLRTAYRDVYRGDMFISAWPAFRVKDDSTTISMHVESRPASELLFAFGYDNDIQARVNGSLVLRPVNRRLPDKITIGATFDPLRKNAFFAFEPHSLARGSDGWFLRGGWRQTDTRLFETGGEVGESRVERLEALGGGQRELTRGYLLQAGAGWSLIRNNGRDRNGLLGSASVQSGSAFGEGVQAVFFAGDDAYASVLARASVQARAGPVIVRAAARAGSSSANTPPDELQALGGPDSFSGLRRREWLGHDRVAGELRLIRNVTSTARLFVYGQGGTITQSVSRTDLDGAVHFAGGVGLEAAIPFGPLNLDWGIDDRGAFRLDFNLGQRF
jgi:predicted acylesterase/phospholipase RssA